MALVRSHMFSSIVEARGLDPYAIPDGLEEHPFVTKQVEEQNALWTKYQQLRAEIDEAHLEWEGCLNTHDPSPETIKLQTMVMKRSVDKAWDELNDIKRINGYCRMDHADLNNHSQQDPGYYMVDHVNPAPRRPTNPSMYYSARADAQTWQTLHPYDKIRLSHMGRIEETSTFSIPAKKDCLRCTRKGYKCLVYNEQALGRVVNAIDSAVCSRCRYENVYCSLECDVANEFALGNAPSPEPQRVDAEGEDESFHLPTPSDSSDLGTQTDVEVTADTRASDAMYARMPSLLHNSSYLPWSSSPPNPRVPLGVSTSAAANPMKRKADQMVPYPPGTIFWPGESPQQKTGPIAEIRRPTDTEARHCRNADGTIITDQQWDAYNPSKKRMLSHVGYIEETDAGMIAPKPCYECTSKTFSDRKRLVCKVYKPESAGKYTQSGYGHLRCSNCWSVNRECPLTREQKDHDRKASSARGDPMPADMARGWSDKELQWHADKSGSTFERQPDGSVKFSKPGGQS